ncbi:lipopolysaccharide-induced tumor necrosis factor-alpha factor homolog isoform X1 [Protopterus annectens]|uniref:lipopolysaccharide-induced tumor necrosis factor-alpha factor homolog isoform X1 n=1 Tax=Protopterus annectens TaxID=7888 RepID=UPI001CF9E17A|nr:lipopolysaccharide-induced tumor necrosis factor-alpha factor homolog isoform X1 [Protopterus annectens]XP_043919246.1 lipopolysaccharide-induced tumor necrosis factor-alpha factor homolog isoform X1 [Protopterus annectens]
MDNPPPYTPYPSAPPNYELGPGNASYLPYPLNPGIVSNPSYPPNPGIPPNPSYPPPPNYTPDPPCQLNPVYPPASATQPGAAYPPNPNYTASPPYPQNPILVPNPANQFSAGPSSAPLPAVNININQNQNQANTGPKRTTAIAQPVVIVTAPAALGSGPTSMTCMTCRTTVVTKVSHKPGALAWMMCIILFILGLFVGCCLIPFCVPSCNDATHKCPNCGTVLGRHRPM